jgi:hypothetical protein
LSGASLAATGGFEVRDERLAGGMPFLLVFDPQQRRGVNGYDHAVLFAMAIGLRRTLLMVSV